MSWTMVIVACAASYALKLAGFFVPERYLEHEKIRLVVEAAPVALLSALIAVQTFTSDERIVLDARAAGLAAAVLALLLRAPFLAVVVLAAAVTAGVRLAVGG
jgi:uncharacterized membrane protein